MQATADQAGNQVYETWNQEEGPGLMGTSRGWEAVKRSGAFWRRPRRIRYGFHVIDVAGLRR